MISSVRIREWESKSALVDHLEGCGLRKALVGVDAEAPRKFYSFSFPSSAGLCEIGILASFHGIEPKVILLNEGKIAVIGLDQWLTGIDTIAATPAFRKRIDGVFYGFLPLPVGDQVIVVHELGALRIDSYGGELWSVRYGHSRRVYSR